MNFEFDKNIYAATSTSSRASSFWYLIYTRSCLETVALQNLQQQGFEAYLILYKSLKKLKLA
jgi:transcriptional antiterminator RfaH